jgi:hypothetical protein
MCILGVELLCQADIFQYLSVCYQTHVNACGYVLSCLALNGLVILSDDSSSQLFWVRWLVHSKTWTHVDAYGCLSYLALNSLVIRGTGTRKPLGVTSSSLTTWRHEPDDGFAQLFWVHWLAHPNVTVSERIYHTYKFDTHFDYWLSKKIVVSQRLLTLPASLPSSSTIVLGYI